MSARRYIALFDFDGTRPVAGLPAPPLVFKVGDVIEHVSREGDFICGSLRGKRGWFPDMVVKKEQVLTRSDNAGSLIPPGLSSPPPLVPSEASVKKVRTPPKDEPAAEYLKSVKVIADWKSSEPGCLAITKGEVLGVISEDGGFCVGLNLAGEKGKFPSAKVSVLATGNQTLTLGRAGMLRQSSNLKRGSTASRNLFAGPTTQRNRIIRELVETERAYNGFLAELEHFKAALEKSAWAAEVPLLFGNVAALRSVSNTLLEKFAVATAMWSSSTGSIASPILAVGPFFMSFAEYAASFNQALKRLEALSADPAFAKFTNDIRKSDQTLSTLAVMPVQRVPRYKMLLEQIIRQTPETHPDLAPLNATLAMISSLAVSVNESVRSSEKTQELLESSKNKETLAQFLRDDRTVLVEVPGQVEVGIEEAKSGIAAHKGHVYLMSDSLLIMLNHIIKDTRTASSGVWIEDFTSIFWPTKLVLMRRINDKQLAIVGPFYHLTLKFKKPCAPFANMLETEIAKHTSNSGNGLRSGVYLWDDYKYDGEWNQDGLMHGKGNMAIGNGCIYSGEWKGAHMTGTGKMKLSNGDMLLGTFVQGLLHGQGVIDYANGDRFSGSFENGVRCGKGEFRCPAASLEYVGEWADDDVHGEGKLVVGKASFTGTFDRAMFVNGEYRSPEGITYTGSFSSFRMMQGTGRIVYADQSQYNGAVRDNVREGQGVTEYADGSRLEGEWRKDVCVNGTWTAGAGHWLLTYVGQFNESGLPHTKNVAKATFADGSTFKGTFVNGAMDKGELSHPTGATQVGKFRGGKLKGKAVVILDNEEEFEGIVESRAPILSVKNRPSVRLPISRPSFPVNLSQGALGGTSLNKSGKAAPK